MSIYPTQERTVDSYEQYNSNVVNRLTRVKTYGDDVILEPNFIKVLWDGTSNNLLTVTSGLCVKDDVVIEVLSNYTLDMSIGDNYINPVDPFWSEVGYYYVVVDYVYQKAKPAPQASIKIFKNSLRPSFNTTQYLFLACVKVEFDSVYKITAVYNYDPEDTDICRKYPRTYAGFYDNLPTWDSSKESQIIYVNGELFFGGIDGWIRLDATFDFMDTYGFPVGTLVYPSSTDGSLNAATMEYGSEHPAAAVVLVQGYKADRSGVVRLYGKTQVNLSVGVSVTIGQALYCNYSNPGYVNSAIPNDTTSSYQHIGYALSAGSGTIDAWFAPKTPCSLKWGSTVINPPAPIIQMDIESLLYPEVNASVFSTADVQGRKTPSSVIGITNNNNGTITVMAGQRFTFRDSISYLTDNFTAGQRTFTTAANMTYHLRFVHKTAQGRDNFGNGFYVGYPGGALTDGKFYLVPVKGTVSNPRNTVYNPYDLGHDDWLFDTRKDDMLVARITTDGSNRPTIVPYINTNNPYCGWSSSASAPTLHISTLNVSTPITYRMVNGVLQGSQSPVYNYMSRRIFGNCTACLQTQADPSLNAQYDLWMNVTSPSEVITHIRYFTRSVGVGGMRTENFDASVPVAITRESRLCVDAILLVGGFSILNAMPDGSRRGSRISFTEVSNNIPKSMNSVVPPNILAFESESETVANP